MLLQCHPLVVAAVVGRVSSQLGEDEKCVDVVVAVVGSVLACGLFGGCCFGWLCRGDRDRRSFGCFSLVLTKSLAMESDVKPSCPVVSQVMSFVRSLLSP